MTVCGYCGAVGHSEARCKAPRGVILHTSPPIGERDPTPELLELLGEIADALGVRRV